MLPNALRQGAVGGLMLWEWIGLPLLISLAALAGWLTARIFTLSRTRLHPASHYILDAARLPAIIAAVTAVLSWGTQEVFVFSSVLAVFFSPLVAVGYTTTALMLVMNGLGAILERLQIALNQSARVGDRIMWQERLCYVEKINFTYILLRNWDDTRVVVPVSEFVTETFDNWTLKDPGIKRILKLKLSPEADVAALREAFTKIVTDMKASDLGREMGDLDEATVNVAGQDALGVDVWFAVSCLDPSTLWEVSCEARERLIKAASKLAEDTGRAVFPDGAAMDVAA